MEKRNGRRERRKGRETEESLIKLGPKGATSIALQHHEVSVCCGSLHGSQRWLSANPIFC